MTSPARYSLLHLQMGQEVIYLIMTVAIVASLFLLLFFSTQHSQLLRSRQTVARLGKIDTVLDGERRRADALSAEVAKLQQVRHSLEEQLDQAKTLIRKSGPMGQKLDQMLSKQRDLIQEREALKEQLAEAQAAMQKRKTDEGAPEDKPPIITLSEAKGYYFKFGSAELSEDFRLKLINEVVPVLLRNGARYHVDVIEVVGHTDEVPVAHGRGTDNLDYDLLPYLHGGPEANLRADDNVGLGMARAAAVVRVLIADGRLSHFLIVPLSAGQTIDINGELALGGKKLDEKERRRLEIRMRRRN